MLLGWVVRPCGVDDVKLFVEVLDKSCCTSVPLYLTWRLTVDHSLSTGVKFLMGDREFDKLWKTIVVGIGSLASLVREESWNKGRFIKLMGSIPAGSVVIVRVLDIRMSFSD